MQRSPGFRICVGFVVGYLARDYLENRSALKGLSALLLPAACLCSFLWRFLRKSQTHEVHELHKTGASCLPPTTLWANINLQDSRATLRMDMGSPHGTGMKALVSHPQAFPGACQTYRYAAPASILEVRSTLFMYEVSRGSDTDQFLWLFAEVVTSIHWCLE